MVRFEKEKLPFPHEQTRYQLIVIGRNLAFARRDQVSGLDTRPFIVVDVIQTPIDLLV